MAEELVEEKKETQLLKNTIVVFGGNGFVGLRICELGINKSYRVIAISRSGCPEWAKQWEFTEKVEWFIADALNPESYTEYITSQNPIAIFSSMGVFNFWTQISNEPEYIEKICGTTNINACKLAKNIESVKKFVYIGAGITNMNIDQNAKYSLKTKVMAGQFRAKIGVEKCVKDLFGDNGICFRPLGIAGIEQRSIFGYKYMGNKLPFYDYDWAKKLYHYLSPKTVTAKQIAQDCFDFIEMDSSSTDIKTVIFKCANSYDDEE